jgi:dipeptidyl aminopeptidase/acylaminoacyl peptidase
MKMPCTRRRGVALLAIVAALVGTGTTHAAEATMALPPVESFYRNADVIEAKLSPSGQLLAATTGIKGKRIGLAVFDLQKRTPGKVVAHFANTDISRFYWVNDEQIVLKTVDTTRGGGEQAGGPGLIAVRADGSDARLLIKTSWDWLVERRTGREALDTTHGLLDVPIGSGNEVIVGRWEYSTSDQLKAVLPMRMDVTTFRTRSLAVGAPDHVKYWHFDPLGEARVAVAQNDGQDTVYWKGPGSDAWKELVKHPTFEPPFEPAFVDSAGTLYVTTQDGTGGTKILRRFDFASGKPASEVLVRTPGFDFHGGPVVDDAGRILGVRVWTDAMTTVWFDERMKQVQKEVDARLPGRVNALSCRRCAADDAVVLVHSWSDQEPGRFALYHPQRKALEGVAAVRADIDPKRMATLDLHRFKARDGLEIPVWVTFPNGADKKTPRAAVVLVHGGPWVKGGSWQWDDDAQFLASRGYVVIEPEFRGSKGYGAALFKAGWKQWGRAMQDDVTDATKWAVAQGWVDPKKVCIAGASYGGYATLMGLAREPDLYRCGVAWVAVTDPRLLADPAWSNTSREFRTYGMPVLIGDPQKDAAALAAVAPVELAAQIKAPVLLAFGGADSLVTTAHGTRMRSALRSAGNEPEWVYYDDEGHGWLKEGNRFDFARKMEAFLAKHLK